MQAKSKKIVCFGGGTGLPALLSGLKDNPWLEISAIVNVFDNGGSSGILRDRYGILPPGDVLKCLLALAEDEISARKILLKRIQHPTNPGHTGGNMLLLALEAVYGTQQQAIEALGQILSIKGRVLPVTNQFSTLCAQTFSGPDIQGETSVDELLVSGREVKRLFLKPAVPATDLALQAIAQADALIVGPGSFYTSLLPNFLPNGITASLQGSKVPIVFICNLLTEGLGMRGQTVQTITAQLESYLGRTVDYIIVNNSLPDQKIINAYTVENKHPLLYSDEFGRKDERIITAPLWLDSEIARHDSSRLANLVANLIHVN